jgi:hypothetical protein
MHQSLVPMTRIERVTSPLPRECSTTEPHGRNRNNSNAGAGEGNRTLVISLEGFCSTIELHPLLPLSSTSYRISLAPLSATKNKRSHPPQFPRNSRRRHVVTEVEFKRPPSPRREPPNIDDLKREVKIGRENPVNPLALQHGFPTSQRAGRCRDECTVPRRDAAGLPTDELVRSRTVIDEALRPRAAPRVPPGMRGTMRDPPMRRA